MNKKRKASGHIPLPALLSPQRSIVLIDPKGELSAVTGDKAKKNAGGVVTVNPFFALPSLANFELCGKWFRLCIGAAMKEHKTTKQRKEGNERQQQRNSQRAH